MADARHLAHAQRDFDLALSRKVRELGRAKADEYRELLREIKVRQHEETQRIRTQGKQRESELREKLLASSKKEKDAYKHALARMKRNHQEQLENLRSLYDRENLRMQKEQESSFNIQLKEIVQNYGSIAAGHQKELDWLKRAHEESDVLIRKKDSEITRLKIELARSSSKLEIKELMLQLNERNVTIEKLNERIQEFESKLGVEKRPPPTPVQKDRPKTTMTDDEQREKLKEYMRAIIEITRSQQAEKKRADLTGRNEERSSQEFGESKVDKVLGWFF